MISLYHKAIICVTSDVVRLKKMEKLLSDYFGKQYVIEVAENSMEVMDIIASLRDIGVETGVLITDDSIGDMTGIALAEIVDRRYPEIKTMLMTRTADIELAQKLLDMNSLYALVKRPIEESHFLQMVENASHQYSTDRELSSLLTKLRLSESEKDLILESISESIIYLDMNRNILWKNVKADEELFPDCADIPSATEKLKTFCSDSAFVDVFMSDEPISEEVKVDTSYKLVMYYPVYDRDRLPAGVVVTFLDVTARHKASDMSASLLEMSRYINEGESLVLFYNKAYSVVDKYFDVKMMCVTGEDFDRDFVEFYGDHSRQADRASTDALIKSIKNIVKKNPDEETIIISNDKGTIIAYPMHGRILMIKVEETLQEGSEGLNYINTIAQHIKLGILKTENYRKIVYQANHDSLTGLFSRDYFISRLGDFLTNSRRRTMYGGFYSLAVLDLNFFKDVNDNLSHLVGDEVLLEIAQRIRSTLRDGDMIGRIGGDEFAILFQAGSRREITALIERLQQSIANPVKVEDIGIRIGSSVGIVYDISGYNSVQSVLSNGDQAMYEAKKNKEGIGTYVFYESHIQDKVAHHNHIERLLKNADFDSEMRLDYQPVVRLDDMSVVGYEGFLRWHAEDDMDYSPRDFIQIADDTGDFLRIGEAVVDMALDSLDELTERSMDDRYIAINLSHKQLLHDEHVNLIKKQVLEHDLGDNRLHIDMNDDFRENEKDRLVRNVQSLRDFGVYVDLDDFSRGNAALSTISKVGVNELKIDGETIRDMKSSDQAMNLTKSIISVAKSLGLKVTAEGVEQEDQLEQLRSLGCDYAQGYYFMEPRNFEDVLSFEVASAR